MKVFGGYSTRLREVPDYFEYRIAQPRGRNYQKRMGRDPWGFAHERRMILLPTTMAFILFEIG